MIEQIISKGESNQRVDKYVRKVLNDEPLSFIYKVFRKKDVKANGKWVDIDYIVKENDIVRIYITDEQLKEFTSVKKYENFQFNHKIIYEDENILIVDKPRGLLVHGDENEKRSTLANQVISYLISKGEYNPREDKGFVPAPAHRLDRNTSGLVVFGKNLPALQSLLDLFQDKQEVEKYYYALVKGHLDKKGSINAPLLKNEQTGVVKVDKNGKTALTLYELDKYYGLYSLASIQIITGRTHQIRVHMAHIGHPLIGDTKYGDFKENKLFKEKYNFTDQFLHSYKLKFKELRGNLEYLSNRTFFSQLPEIEQKILDKLKS